MGYTIQPASPCPDCGGRRSVIDGGALGLEYLHHCDAVYCTVCRRVTFYVQQKKLEELMQDEAKQQAKEQKKRGF